MGKKKTGQRIHVKLRSTESTYVYHSVKNKRNTTERILIKKYDPILRKHVDFKEER